MVRDGLTIRTQHVVTTWGPLSLAPGNLASCTWPPGTLAPGIVASWPPGSLEPGIVAALIVATWHQLKGHLRPTLNRPQASLALPAVSRIEWDKGDARDNRRRSPIGPFLLLRSNLYSLSSQITGELTQVDILGQ